MFTKKEIFQYIQGASLLFALLIAFQIPSYRWILSDIIVGWMLFSILEFKFKQRFKQNLNNRFLNIMFILQLILFLFVLSNVFFADDEKNVSKQIMQKLSLLIFPLLFALSASKFKERKQLFLKLFAISTVLMSLICISVALYKSISFLNGVFTFNPVNELHRNYFRQSELSIFHHRGYFSMYIVFALAIIFYLNEKQNIFSSKFKKVLFWLVILFFITMIFLLTSRAGIISLVILLSWQLVHKIFFSKNLFYKILTFLLIILMVVVSFMNKRIQTTFNQIVTTEKTNNTNVSGKSPARIDLWKAGFNIVENNFWIGIGTEKFQENFNNEYKKYSNKKISEIKSHNLNVHNQFLEEFVLYGIFGFLLLLSLFIYPIFISFKRKNYLFLSFLLITGFNFLFESMLNTIAGIVFFTFFLNYFIFVFDDTNEKIKITE
ncbi:MAG: O-antigen ligase family protein [Chlorobi bacterium]|nr:O-antigen ligase family protein [Chlorobiota bacterium]